MGREWPHVVFPQGSVVFKLRGLGVGDAVGLRAGWAARPYPDPQADLSAVKATVQSDVETDGSASCALNAHRFDSLVSRESNGVYVCGTSGLLLSDLKAALFTCRDVLWTLRYT